MNPMYEDHSLAMGVLRPAINACFKDPGGNDEDRSAHIARCRAAVAIHQGASIEEAFREGVGDTVADLMLGRVL